LPGPVNVDVLVDRCDPGPRDPVVFALIVLRQLDGAVGVEVVDRAELATVGANDRLVLPDPGYVCGGKGHGVGLLGSVISRQPVCVSD